MIKKALKLVHWSDFHLSSLGGVVMSFPGVPVDTISVRWVRSMMIDTVQVGCMTICVPPGSFVGHSTVTARGTVIILIFGWKGVTTMTSKRISCCPCTKTREYIFFSYEIQDSGRVFFTSILLTNVQVIKTRRKANNQRKMSQAELIIETHKKVFKFGPEQVQLHWKRNWLPEYVPMLSWYLVLSLVTANISYSA